jgi:uncharacterized protein with GYD domain
MQTYIMLTHMSPESATASSKLLELEHRVAELVRDEVPGIEWVSSYAVLGACDYLDVFRAPDAESAAKVALIVRTHGHASTELWSAVEWPKFKPILNQMADALGERVSVQ